MLALGPTRPSQGSQDGTGRVRHPWASASSPAPPGPPQGDADAQGMLGIMYQAGDGVPQDYVEAHKWFNLSAAWAPDADIRERAVKARDELASMMTPAQVAKAQRMSREWQPK